MSNYLTGVPNAGQTGIVFNDKTIAQSTTANQVGINSIGLHYQLGCALTEEAGKAWEDYVADVYSTLMRFSNYKMTFTEEEVNLYLQTCLFTDVAIAECARDVKMLNFQDVLANNPLADFYGTGWNTSIKNERAEIIHTVVKFNSLVADYTSHFAHPTFPMATTLTYLVGNVFVDDKSDRANYIYFHMLKSKMATASTTNVSIIDELMHPAIDTQQAKEYDWTAHWSEIHSMILKVYGDQALYRYPLLNISDTVKPIFDGALNSALRNIYCTPNIYCPSGEGYYTTNGWSDLTVPNRIVANSQLAAATSKEGGMATAAPRPNYTAQNIVRITGSAEKIKAQDISAIINDGRRLYTGTNFSGEALCSDLFFSQSFVLSDVVPGQLWITPKSRSGIITLNAWYNTIDPITGTVNANTAVGSVVILSPEGVADVMFHVDVMRAIRMYSQCFVGRVNIMVADATINAKVLSVKLNNQFTVGTDIDEFAIYSDVETIMLPTVKSFFVAGVNVYKPEYNTKSASSQPAIKDSNSATADKRKVDKFRGKKGNR